MTASESEAVLKTRADPTKLPSYKEAMAGMSSLWRKRMDDYFLDIADDGYTIASGPPVSEEEASRVHEYCIAWDWYACPVNNCLAECTAQGCSCSRTRNPSCRESFMRTVVQRVVEVAQGKSEVAYASLGSGYLRFDFGFLECLLAAGVPVTSVHLVDEKYEPAAEGHGAYRVALAQFASWFGERGVDVYAHASLEKFAFRARQANLLPHCVLQVDCAELTWVFDSAVKPMLEEVLQYGGLFCALTAREGATGVGNASSGDAWGELWRLTPESGRMKIFSKLRFRPGQREPQHLGEDEALPPAQGH